MDNYNNGNNYGGGNNNNRNNGGGNNNNNKKPKNTSLIVFIIIAAVITFIGITMLNNLVKNATYKEITYNEFIEMVNNDEVKSVALEQDRILITPVDSAGDTPEANKLGYTYYTGYVNDDTLVPLLKRKGIEFSGYIPDSNSSIVEFLVAYVLPFLFIYVIFAFVYRRISKGGGMMGGMGVGKNNAKVYVQKKTGVTFKDVAGQDEAKESLTEIVDFLHNPDKYSKIGAKLPKGALLVGPPGTGKTLLAKAVAGEANVPFFSLAGSDFVEMFVGVGASRVRDLFKEATKQAPCIIFIDEIDAIGKSRDSRYGGGNDEREQTLNQLLAEMDGFDSSKGIFILAATNRPEVLDKALLRPGRLDRRVIVDKPDLKGRIETLKVHSKDVLMDDTVNFEEIYTEGISKITAEDFKYAKKMGRSIKLLGKCKNEDTGIVCSVAPRLLAPDHPLYNVSGVTNGILVRGNMVGDLVFIGSGAGKLPTASAVVSDVVDSVRHLNVSTTVMWKEEKLEVEDFSKSKKKFFVRTTKSKEEVEAVFGNVEYIDAGISGEIGFATEKLSEQDFDAKAEKLGNVISRIRIEG